MQQFIGFCYIFLLVIYLHIPILGFVLLVQRATGLELNLVYFILCLLLFKVETVVFIFFFCFSLDTTASYYILFKVCVADVFIMSSHVTNSAIYQSTYGVLSFFFWSVIPQENKIPLKVYILVQI